MSREHIVMDSRRRALKPLIATLLLLASCPLATNAADWPLSGYAPCVELPTRKIAAPWGARLQLDTADISFNDDANLLWVAAEGLLHKFRYSDGALLSSLNLEAVGESFVTTELCMY